MKKVHLVASAALATALSLPASAARWVIPGSAHAQGSGGTNWRTDLTLLNPASQAVTATIRFLPANTDNGSLPVPATRTVPAGGQVVVPDVLDTLFGRSGGGALLVESAEGSLTVSSRTYNKLPDREYGMALPGIATNAAIAPGETGHLVYLAKSTRYRTNLGFAATTATRGTVRVRVRNAAGTLIGEGTREILPNGQTQIDDVFGALGAPATTVARAEVTADVPVVAYATVIDNRTGDPFAVVAQKASSAAADLVVPSSVHKDGANGAKYRSDLRVFNPSTDAATVTLALYPGGTTTSAPVTRTVPLGPGGLAGLDDVLLGTFGLGDAYGALRISSTKPVLALTNTYNDAPEGTSGQELPAVPVSAFAAAGDLLRFAGISGDGFRTNLLLVNLGATALELDVTSRSAGGDLLVRRAVTVPSNAMLQENDLFPTGVTGFLEVGPPASARVAGGTPTFYALATVIHNVSNDPFQVTPFVQAASPAPGACVRPTLPKVGTVYGFRVTAPDGVLNATTTFLAVSDTVSTSKTDATSPAGSTSSTATKTIAYLAGNLIGVVSVDDSSQTPVGTVRTIVTFSPTLVGAPGPEVCSGFTWTSPSVSIHTTTTTPYGSGSQTSASVPSRGRVVSADETITVPAGTFRTYHLFVDRDDQTTTETWLSHDGGLAIRQVDVTSKGTQTTEATKLQ